MRSSTLRSSRAHFQPSALASRACSQYRVFGKMYEHISQADFLVDFLVYDG